MMLFQAKLSSYRAKSRKLAEIFELLQFLRRKTSKKDQKHQRSKYNWVKPVQSKPKCENQG